MLITVRRFHDHDRNLQDLALNPTAVAAIGPPTDLYGPHGTFTCRQVWLLGGHWFFLEDDGTLLDRLRGDWQPEAQS